MKVYKRRDSATAILRKAGIKSRDYNLYVNKIDGQFHLNLDLLKKWEDSQKRPDKPCCQVAYDLIKEGKSNQEVWAIIQPMFNLEDKKKYYPSWYRCHLRRMGEIPNDTRVTERHVEVFYE